MIKPMRRRGLQKSPEKFQDTATDNTKGNKGGKTRAIELLFCLVVVFFILLFAVRSHSSLALSNIVTSTLYLSLNDERDQPLGGVSWDVEIAPGVRMPFMTGGNSHQALWLKQGGRSLDTAFRYGDRAQRAVGRAVAESGKARSEMFITTKVMCCPTNRNPQVCTPRGMKGNGPGNAQLVNDQAAQLTKSLKLLNTSYVDLLLLHMPCSTLDDTMQAWRILETEQRSGRTRAIGVSNFNASLVSALAAQAEIKPALNQCSFSVSGHPVSGVGATAFEIGSRKHGSDDDTLQACRKHGVTYSAYSPLGQSSKVNVLGNPTVLAVAAAHNYTPAQVALRWAVQQGVPVITSSSKPAHVDEVLAVPQLKLTDQEMNLLDKA